MLYDGKDQLRRVTKKNASGTAEDRDTVEVRCNKVYVNGSGVAETLVREATTFADPDANPTVRAASLYREKLGAHSYETFHEPERPDHDRRGVPRAAEDSHDFPALDVEPQPPFCDMRKFQQRRAEELRPQAPEGVIVETARPASACHPQRHYVVPQGTVFVLGDNRFNANDSRYWGALRLDAVVGIAAPPET
ncbi:MAG: S26 family signal peptidase [Kofleriaceae bacterium]|nr:S26 family signal peptidase [Kofleriaceae bacterium]